MTDVDHDPTTSESGIRKFIRGILPHWPRSSPQGGATPTHNEAPDAGNEEVNSTQSLELKRKSSFLRNDDDSDDSDYEENLPSHKRQRVTVSAMRRLFAKFSLSDKESADTSTTHNLINGEPSEKFSLNEKTNFFNIPDDSFESELPALLPSLTSDNPFGKISSSSSNNNEDDIPNMNNKDSPITAVKRDNTSTENTKSSLDGKRRKTKHTEDTEETNQTDVNKTPAKKSENSNKRHVDISESENEENQENRSKVKRTRRLRRGLRLCTNITCYIEQVIYN